MAKLRKTQNDFSAGEIAPYSQGRVDVAINYKGAKKILNFIPLIQGGLTRRPATRHIKEAASSSSLNRLIPFIYSTEENFVLNFTHNSVDIVESIDGSEAVVATLETPYSEDDIYNIQYTQSVNVLILVCRGKQPRQITRTGTNWEISTIVFEDGPYFEQNKSETVVTIEDFVDRGVLYCSEPVFTEDIVGSIIEYRYEGDYYLAECISLIDSQNMEVRPIENTLTQVDDRTVLTITTPDSVQIDSSIAIFSNSVVNRHIKIGRAHV